MDERIWSCLMMVAMLGGCALSRPSGDAGADSGTDADSDSDVDSDTDADGDTDADTDADTDTDSDADGDCGEVLSALCGGPAPNHDIDVRCEDVAPCGGDGDCVVTTVDPCCGMVQVAVLDGRQDEVAARLGECDRDPKCPACKTQAVHAECVAGSCLLVAGDEPVVCGGWVGDTCRGDEFCDFEGDQCDWADASGTCHPRPAACDENIDLVCGCDGQEYSNLCVAQSEGVDAAFEGTCEGL